MDDSPGWGLRALALQTDPVQMWMGRSPYAPVYGFVLDELIDAGGWWSLAAFSEGSTSIYTSGPGSVIGVGPHVVAESAALLTVVRERLPLFAPSAATDLPAPGTVALRALTTTGQLVITTSVDELVGGEHPASDVYAAALALVSAVRAATPA